MCDLGLGSQSFLQSPHLRFKVVLIVTTLGTLVSSIQRIQLKLQRQGQQ